MFDKRTHTETDAYLPITVNVGDKNDNVPEFVGMRVFTLQERSKAGKEKNELNCIFKGKVHHFFVYFIF